MNEDQKYIYDLIAASAERTVKRLWIVIIILIMALCASNACWIYYESQFQDVVTTQEVSQDIDTGDGDLGNVIGIGNNYGEGETNNEDDNQN